MTEYYCNLACVPVRREASSSAEMVTQLLYGEPYVVLEGDEEWLLIRSEIDSYSGYISNSQHGEGTDKDQHRYMVTERFVEVEGVIYPMGSRIRVDTGQTVGDLYEQGMKLLNAPYLWGGKTFMGIDCSALVQVAFSTLGFTFPRDSGDQFKHRGESVHLNEARRNDLVFFANERGKVVHVGVYNGDGQILHASGNVRLDRLDEQGIYRERPSGGRYTHHKPVVRRYL